MVFMGQNTRFFQKKGGRKLMGTFWQGVSSRLRERLDQVAFETWISPLNFVGIEGHTATLQAPNKFFRNWVNDRYLNDLRQCVSAETGVNVEIALVAAQQDSKQDGVSQVQVSPPTARCQTSNLNPGGRSNLDPRYTFDQFVVGSSNQFAHAAAMAVANQPGEKYNPLFLYGGVGLGKTQLVLVVIQFAAVGASAPLGVWALTMPLGVRRSRGR